MATKPEESYLELRKSHRVEEPYREKVRRERAKMDRILKDCEEIQAEYIDDEDHAPRPRFIGDDYFDHMFLFDTEREEEE